MTPDPLTVLCGLLRGDVGADQASTAVIDLARRHRVHLLLAWLQKHDRGLDDRPTSSALAEEMRVEALLDELRVRELVHVVDALERVGARPVVFKGAALAHTHYAESWLRPRLDADVLIDPDKRLDAVDCLQQLGYTRPPFIAGDLVMHQAPFVRAGGAGLEHVVDLHWRIANPQVIAGVLSHDELRRAAHRIEVRGTSLDVPSPVHALLLACVHRVAHHYDAEDLVWLYDIHLLAQSLDAPEWIRLVELAAERSVKAICARSLSQSVDRFHTTIPDEVLARLTPRDRGDRPEPSSVYLQKDLRHIQRLASDLRALGPWAGARLIREHLFPPAGYMREKYGVRSGALLPAFYMLRIFAGMSKWVRSAERKLAL